MSRVELDALEADMGMETEPNAVPSYLQPDKETELEEDMMLPAAPTAQAAAAQPNWHSAPVGSLSLI